MEVRGQCDLRGRRRTAGRVFEHLLARDPCGLRVLARAHQCEGDIRHGVDREFSVRVGVCDISDVRQEPARHGRQFVLGDSEDVAAHRFAGCERSLGAGALFALPCDGERGIAKRNGRLVRVDHGRDDQLAGSGRPVGRVGYRVYIINLCSRLVRSEICRKRLAIRKVDDGLGTCCNNCHIFPPYLFVG